MRKKKRLPAEEKQAKNTENAAKIKEKIGKGEKLNFSERNILNIINRKNEKK